MACTSIRPSRGWRLDLAGERQPSTLTTALEHELEEENRRLRKICQALMERVESAGMGSAPYGAFEHAVLLAEQVRERTETLHRTLDELAEANARLEEARREAEAANASKTRFLAAVSHDLLQPLNAARLFASALEEQQLGHEPGRLVHRIDRSLADVELLLGTLVDISRLDAGVLTPDIAPFSVAQLLDVLAEECRQMAGARGLALRYVASSAWIASDLALLARVIRNLMSNAVRYTESGRVLLGCRRRQIGGAACLEIVVGDTGPGIDAARQQDIFLEFRRGDADAKAQERGLGLGLAIVERIARLLDHPIRLVSRPGHGALFSVTVPLVESVPTPLETPDRQRLPGEEVLAGSLVWVLDNDRAILDGMRALLGGWGCESRLALEVSELEQSLDSAEAAPDTPAGPRVVMIDYHLADDEEDGLSLAQRLAASGRGIVPILITANHDAAIKRRCREQGITCLLKPVKPLRLRQALVHLLS
ncbi:hybrid sensor histidine kinase/response regulator [Halomonas sp. DP8Y7-1]|nr:hybrid sensor histidine kinase/response regulator [Halomonas sp. DP8Y7-1]